MWSTTTISTLSVHQVKITLVSFYLKTCLSRWQLDFSNCLFLYSILVITFSLINYVNEKSCQKQTMTPWQLSGVSPPAVLNGTGFVMIVFILLCLSLLRISFGKWLTSAVMMMGGGPAFNNINRPRTVRRKMAPFLRQTTMRTHAVNRVLTGGGFWSRLCLLWPSMFSCSVIHLTPTQASKWPCSPIVFQP